MGRVAGVTAGQTRARLIDAAADCFATRGYDGTRVGEIAAAAGVSNGALYAHFDGKAELLVAAVRDRAPRELQELFLADPEHGLLDLLVTLGAGLPRRDARSRSLIVEALVAARRDEAVRRLMARHLGDRGDWLAGQVRDAQASGEIDPGLAPEVVARFCLAITLGSALIPAIDLPPVDPDAWAALVDRLADALTPRPTPRGARP